MSLEENFRSELLTRIRKNMYKNYFSKSSQFSTIKIRIVTGNDKPLIPFRNINCENISCIYDLNDLIVKYKGFNYQNNLQFTCEKCEKPLIMNDFYYDITLKANIDKIWKKSNEPYITVTEAILNNDGILHIIHDKKESEQNKIIENQVSKNSNDDFKEEDTKKRNGSKDTLIRRGPKKIMSLVSKDESDSLYYPNIPLINDFKNEDMSLLYKTISILKGTTVVTKLYNVSITKSHIDNSLNECGISPEIMAFFARYIQNYLKNSGRPSREYITGLLIKENNEIEYLPTFKNDPQTILDEKESIILIFKNDHHWMLANIDFSNQKCTLIDFLANDLSNITSHQDTFNSIKNFIKEKFGIKILSISMQEVNKSKQNNDCTNNDCGLIIMKFIIHYLINRSAFSSIKLNYNSNSSMKRIIPWLILKLNSIVANQLELTPNQNEKLLIKEDVFISESISNLNNLNNNKNNKIAFPTHVSLKKRNSLQFEENGQQLGKTPTIKLNKENSIIKQNNSFAKVIGSKKQDQRGRRSSINISTIINNNEFNNGDYQTPIPSVDDIDLRGLNDPIDFGNNAKVSKKQLYQILKDFKNDLLTKQKKNNNSVTQFLSSEGIIEDLDNGKAFSKKDLQNIIKRYQFLLELDCDKNLDKFKEKPSTPKIYEEIAFAYKKYMEEASQLYNILGYFYIKNADIYEKITHEISSQIEDQLLEKYKILYIKYPHLKNATHFLQLNAKNLQNIGVPEIKQQSSTKAQSAMYSKKLEPIKIAPNSVKNIIEVGISTLISKSSIPRSIKLQPINFELKKKVRKVKSMPRRSTTASPEYDFEQPMQKKDKKILSELEIYEDNIIELEPPMKEEEKEKFSELKSSEERIPEFEKPTKEKENKRPSGLERVDEHTIDMNLQEAGISPKKHKSEYIAKRYGISITKNEYMKLNTSNELNDTIMEFFIEFLKEKQKQVTSDYIQKHDLKILFFDPSFFRDLVDDDFESLNIYYDRVEALTSEYSGVNQTIFHQFNKILFLIKKNTSHYMLVLIDCKDRKIYLFDTEKKNLKSPINNPILHNFSQYIEKEIYNKSTKNADLHKWQFMYGDVKKHDDYKDSAFIMAKIIYNIYDGIWKTIFSPEDIDEFREKLIKLIIEIGVTKDLEGELGDLTVLSL